MSNGSDGARGAGSSFVLPGLGYWFQMLFPIGCLMITVVNTNPPWLREIPIQIHKTTDQLLSNVGLSGVIPGVTISPVDPCKNIHLPESAGIPYKVDGTMSNLGRVGEKVADTSSSNHANRSNSDGNAISNPPLILVTGGSGFIGSHLVESLLELGYRVRVFDNLETGNALFLDFTHPRLEFLLGDITDMKSVEKAFQPSECLVGEKNALRCGGPSGFQPGESFGDEARVQNSGTQKIVKVPVSIVFHLAAASKVLPSLKDPAMATFNTNQNSVGTANVLQAAKLAKTVKKVLYAASSTYYGNHLPPQQEDMLFMPSSPYAASKYSNT
jgi:NAD(P)-dependent dehydrogenase (short-subunit alcohol dehydrogenase family)